MRKFYILIACLLVALSIGGCVAYTAKHAPVVSSAGAPVQTQQTNSLFTYWMWYHWMNSSNSRTIYLPPPRSYPSNVAPPSWDAPSHADYTRDSFSGWDDDDSYSPPSYSNDTFDNSYSDDSFSGWDSWGGDTYSDDSFSGWDSYDSYDSGGYSDDSFSDW
jgi:hypothetical protein